MVNRLTEAGVIALHVQPFSCVSFDRRSFSDYLGMLKKS
jgi:hypothetical protein